MQLETCLVCGHEPLEQDQDKCLSCQTPTRILAEILEARSKPRFLFGSLKSLGQAADEPKIEVENKAPHAPVQALKPKPRPSQPAVRRPSAPVQTKTESASWLAWSIDFILVLLINAGVLSAIIQLSKRTFNDLIQFSLIPVIIVILTLTTSYFWLFKGLVKKSFGQILIEKK